jgi:single-strand DNA-binding protein
MNSITLIGNITRDPELRYTPSGKAICSFSIAVAQYKKDDEWISDFFNCVVWGKLAENAAKSLFKGDKVILSGKIYVEQWEDKKSGDKRQATKIRVDNMGPELTFATCEVSRNDKAKPRQSEPDERPEDDEVPW